MERLIAYQVVFYLESEELMHRVNYGFQRNHGTDTAVVEAQGVIFDAIEHSDTVGTMTLDQLVAFDILSIQYYFSLKGYTVFMIMLLC